MSYLFFTSEYYLIFINFFVFGIILLCGLELLKLFFLFQVVNGNLEDELEEFVHFKGNNLLPTREGVFKLENVTNLNLSVTRPNISFNVVRLIVSYQLHEPTYFIIFWKHDV